VNNLYKINESFVKITKLSQKQLKSLVNWFNKQNILIQIDIFKEQKNQFFKLKNIEIDKEIIPLAAFYLSINKYHSIFNLDSKNKSLNLTETAKVSKFLIKQAKKSRKKKKQEKLLNFQSIIVNLKDNGFSFREISKYLKRKHHFDVSHTYIRKHHFDVSHTYIQQIFNMLKNEELYK